MKITAIKQQVKQQGRYSIFVEGKYAFSLSDTGLLESRLVNGQELTESDVAAYKRLSADDKLYNRTLQYAVLRPRSAWEITFYLQRKKTDPLLSQQIVNKLTKLQLVDDLKFAQSWIANRRLLKSTSRRRLQQELRAKHVSDAVIEQALVGDDTDERSLLSTLVERKRKQTRYQDDQKLMQYLARQGFSYDDIKNALQEDG